MPVYEKVPKEYEYFVVQPVRLIEGDGYEVVSEEEAEYWGLYGVIQSPFVRMHVHIRDFKTKKDAHIALKILAIYPEKLNEISNLGFAHPEFYCSTDDWMTIRIKANEEKFTITFQEEDEWNAITLKNGYQYDVHRFSDDGMAKLHFYVVLGGVADTSEEGRANSYMVLI